MLNFIRLKKGEKIHAAIVEKIILNILWANELSQNIR